jgi:hypothetical protein
MNDFLRELQALVAGKPDTAKLALALRLLAKWRSRLIENTLRHRDGTTVLSGPFKGMAYDIAAAEGAYVARLLGSYERSLAPVIEDIIAAGYPLVIDIGCAEGYYAVGLARRMPQTLVLARDDNPQAKELCAALALANGVGDRVQVGGRFRHADFAICNNQPTVVICDIEGAEAALLDPTRAPGLLVADILVEVHETTHPGLLDELTDRFTRTHVVTRIDRKLDDSALPDWMESLSDMDRLLALWEWRAGPTPWLWMQRDDGMP